MHLSYGIIPHCCHFFLDSCFQLFLLSMYFQDISANLFITLKFWCFFSFQSLSIVELNSSSLVSLSLAGCRSMTFLRLSCPNLQNVNLDGCDHLQSAAFCPVSLLISSDVQYILLLLANLLADIRCNFVFSTWIEYNVAFLGNAVAYRI